MRTRYNRRVVGEYDNRADNIGLRVATAATAALRDTKAAISDAAARKRQGLDNRNTNAPIKNARKWATAQGKRTHQNNKNGDDHV